MHYRFVIEVKHGLILCPGLSMLEKFVVSSRPVSTGVNIDSAVNILNEVLSKVRGSIQSTIGRRLIDVRESMDLNTYTVGRNRQSLSVD